MKKLAALVLGCLLTVSVGAAGQPSDVDQKWLDAVKKMVANGQATVTTSNESRVSLLKEWAGKEGYAVRVNKTDTGYRLEVAKSLAQK